VCDANDLHLGHQARADGRWRIYVFAPGTPAAQAPDAGERLTAFADWMTGSPSSPLAATPEGAPVDAWFDVKVIYPQDHTGVDIIAVPDLFKPRTGPFGIFDWEKVYAADPANDIYDLRGIDRDGVIVVVRPDHYVANVLPLSATDELGAFFAGTRAGAAAAVS
jgi:phenol 2-monooxygenase